MHRVTFDPNKWLNVGVALFGAPKSLADPFKRSASWLVSVQAP